MATRYLLTCSCGAEVPVEPGRAGESLTCEACEQPIQVPRLGDLRLLPRKEVADERSSNWSLRKGLVVLGLAVALLLAIPGFVIWLKTPDPPQVDTTAELEELNATWDKLTVRDLYFRWQFDIVPLAQTGLVANPHPNRMAYDRQVETLQLRQNLFFSAAGFALLLAIIAAIWKSP